MPPAIIPIFSNSLRGAPPSPATVPRTAAFNLSNLANSPKKKDILADVLFGGCVMRQVLSSHAEDDFEADQAVKVKVQAQISCPAASTSTS